MGRELRPKVLGASGTVSTFYFLARVVVTQASSLPSFFKLYMCSMYFSICTSPNILKQNERGKQSLGIRQTCEPPLCLFHCLTWKRI